MIKKDCPACGKVGFVRVETMVKGETVTKVAYCGACNATWEERDTPPAQSGT